MKKLVQAQGQWVSGSDRFWNRDRELRRFIEVLDEGGSIHLSAQRRIGKTSLMREAARRIGDRFTCVHVDVEDARSAEDFIAALGAATKEHLGLWSRTVEVFRNALGASAEAVESLQVDEVTIKIREGLVGGTWTAKADRLIAALAGADRRVVLFLDEVPVMVNRILKGQTYETTPERREAADLFLSWMRKAALRHQGRVQFVVTGSIGFGPILREANLSATINHLTAFDLRPWDAETAVGCLQALGNQYGLAWADGAAERVTERLGMCVPHHVQVFFGHVREVTERRGASTCTVEDVETAYQTHMLGSRGHAELSTFEERLSLVVPHDARAFVFDLLTEAAAAGRLSENAINVYLTDHGFEGRAGTDIARHVLDVLDHDGYLHPDGDGHTFSSHLLRDWWVARHGNGFTAASNR
jgi:hypothetical protein